MPWRRATPVLGFVVLCTACSGNGEEQEPPYLSVNPSRLTMTPGDPPYTFAADIIEGGPADSATEVYWTLTGRGTLGATAGSTTTYTPPDRAPPGETVTLTAQWHDQVRDAVITLSPPPVDVSGRVVESDGRAIAGARVETNPYSPYGRLQTATDASGSFRLGALRIPYDVIVVAPDRVTIGMFEGLLRGDPRLVLVRRTDAEAAATRATPVSASTPLALPATQLEPPPGATDVIFRNGDPHFTWTAFPGGLTVVALAGPPGGLFVSIVAAGTTSYSPDVWEFRPNGETWIWRVFGIGGVGTVDAFTGFPTDEGTTFTVSEPWTLTFRHYEAF